VLAHWNNSFADRHVAHSDTLSWSRANQYLLFLLNAVCLVYVICVCFRVVIGFFLFSLSTSCARPVQHILCFYFYLYLVYGGVQYCVVYFALFVFVLCLVASFSRLSILHCAFWLSSIYFEYIWCFAEVISACHRYYAFYFNRHADLT
jgi:hypothetical protein